MTTWGNDITIVVPEDGDGNQLHACIGYLYVNGVEVKCDEVEIDVQNDDINTVTVKMLAENLRIVSASDISTDPKPINFEGRRRVVIRKEP